MNRKLNRVIGKLRFGDQEQIRLKRLLGEDEGASAAERIGAFLDEALLRIEGCPPEALASWARGLHPEELPEARRKVEGLRAVVLAMDVFLEEERRRAR